MASKYIIKWSMSCCNYGGEIVVDHPQDVAEIDTMDEDERRAHFQRLVDDEVAINGPVGVVDSTDE